LKPIFQEVPFEATTSPGKSGYFVDLLVVQYNLKIIIEKLENKDCRVCLKKNNVERHQNGFAFLYCDWEGFLQNKA
jgi:hypothetical protein